MGKRILIFLLFPSFLFGGNLVSKLISSQDVITVVNTKNPVPAEGSRKRLVFTPELTIGIEEGDENYMFGNSIQVIADDQGCFYVLDWDRKRIQKYDPEGKYLFTIGRKGQGPGEFGNIWEMRFDSEGNIYATDIVNNRVSFFSTADGQFKKQFRIEQNIGGVIFLSNTKFYSVKSIQREESGVFKVDFLHGLFDENCQPVTELYLDKGGFQSPRRKNSRAEFLAELLSGSAYKPYVVSRVTDDERILMGYSETYEIKVHKSDGKLLQIIQKTSDPRKISREHEDFYFRHQVTDFLRSFPQDMSLTEEVRKHMKYPKYLPAYLGFIPMDNGWLFVVVDSLEKKSEIDLFDEKGVYIGQFESDIPALSLFFKSKKAYTVANVNDYNFVQRYSYQIVNY